MMIKMLAPCLLPRFLFECRAVKYGQREITLKKHMYVLPLPQLHYLELPQ